jgi:AcrR family transcriptional regulator
LSIVKKQTSGKAFASPPNLGRASLTSRLSKISATAAASETAPRKSEATRQRILGAAARVFREHGYVATRLTDIAEEIGMKPGSLYYHFESREALVEELINAGVRRTRQAAVERLASLPADAGPLDKLAAMVESHLLMVLEQGETSSATIQLIWQVPAEIRERTLAVERGYGALWRRMLEEAKAAGAIRPDVNLSVIRMSILGALNWAADWYHPTGASPSSVAKDIIRMVLFGLATSDSRGDGNKT